MFPALGRAACTLHGVLHGQEKFTGPPGAHIWRLCDVGVEFKVLDKAGSGLRTERVSMGSLQAMFTVQLCLANVVNLYDVERALLTQMVKSLPAMQEARV